MWGWLRFGLSKKNLLNAPQSRETVYPAIDPSKLAETPRPIGTSGQIEGLEPFDSEKSQSSGFEYKNQQNPIGKNMEDFHQTTSLKGMIEICSHEGIVIERYRDSVRIWTIGVGVTAAARASINPNTYSGTITIRQAIEMMVSVLPQYERIVRDLIGPVTLPQHVFDALVCAAYNIGPRFARGNLTQQYVSRGEYRKALLLWKLAGGKVSHALLKRRKAEAMLAETGIYSDHAIPLYDGQGPGNTPNRIGSIWPDEIIQMMDGNAS